MVKFLFGILSLVVLVFVIALTFIAAVQDKDRVTVKYDCRMLMGNWHPDFPAAVIEECKKRIKQ
jgi:hypothetical protein